MLKYMCYFEVFTVALWIVKFSIGRQEKLQLTEQILNRNNNTVLLDTVNLANFR